MLYFVSTELSLCYLFFAFLSALGVLQWVAARYHLGGLAFLDYSKHPLQGYVFGALLMLSGALAYFVSQWAMILTPGLAGAELTVLFSAAALFAWLCTLILASFLQPRHVPKPQIDLAEGQIVTVGPAMGRLYTPVNLTLPAPAVCLLPGLGLDRHPLVPLTHLLLEQDLIVLAIEPDAQSYVYPGIMAVLPAALTLLSKLPEVNTQKLGVLGYDLGGDLAIRSASVDRQIKAVLALAPILVEPLVSLDLLSEMLYLPALRWARDKRRHTLCKELTAWEYGAKIAPRPLLLMYGSEDRLVTRTPVESWDAQYIIIQGAAHLDLPRHPLALQTVVGWFKEHL